MANPMFPEEDFSNNVIAGNALFSRHLYYKLKKKTKGNIFYSPLSIHILLSIVVQGAHADTKKTIMQTLAIPTPLKTAFDYKRILENLNTFDNVELLLSNKVYIYECFSFKQEFENVVTDSFKAETEKIDFSNSSEAASSINCWVEKKTDKKITNLISETDLDENTRLLLVNAIYFKGKWAEPFEPEATTTEKFYINDNDTVDVEMMHITNVFKIKELPYFNVKVLALPYQNEKVNLLIILPEKRTGLQQLENILLENDLTKMEKSELLEVNLSLPKFKIESTMELATTLSELGLGVIFNDGADFPGLLENDEKISISKVIQKAIFEVNEEGAEATASAALHMGFRSMQLSEPETFVVNHPFLFAIQAEHSPYQSIVLFEGRITNPNETANIA